MNELDKISEKILKQIIKHDNELSPRDFYNIKVLKKYTNQELAECLRNLKSLDFVHLNDDESALVITFKGKQYFLLKSKQIRKTFLLSFLLPLIISIVAAYLTAKLTVNNETIILVNSINTI